MSNGLIDHLMDMARKAPPSIVFPESDQEKILKAACRVRDLRIGSPVLVGNRETIGEALEKLNLTLEGISIVDNAEEETIDRLVGKYLSISGQYSEKFLRRKMQDPQNCAAIMVRCDEADCLASGINHTTGEVILCSQMLIGMKEGISTISSMGIMEVPGFEGSEGNLIAISDCAVCVDPTPEERADIAIASADTVKNLLGWEPRVALLSFSTKGSTEHPRVEEILQTLKIVRERRPDILIDGDLQLDAAIVPEVAAKKVKGESPVAGKANVLVFPDLEAGNIGVKLVQRFAKGIAHGPFLQGFAKTVTDFSRSAPLEEMLGAISIAAVQAGREKSK
jgi:phosphate acetyltransferase